MRYLIGGVLFAMASLAFAATVSIDFLYCKNVPSDPSDTGIVIAFKPGGSAWSDYEWGVISPPSGVVLSITTQTIDTDDYANISDAAGTVVAWYVDSTVTVTAFTKTPIVE